jgi:transcriptional regulator with XRE-family HTH domain
MHMTLNELADQLGISQQQIQKYETGDSRISASMVLAISEALNIGIEDLFTGTRNRKKSKRTPLETARRECQMWIERASSKETLHQMARVLKAMSQQE